MQQEPSKKQPVLGIRLLPGMGFGNRLFVYLSTRCLAGRNDMAFSVLDRELLEKSITVDGKKLFDLDYGEALSEKDFPVQVAEKDERIYIPDSEHDLTRGCYVAGADEKLFALQKDHPGENILLSGNLQAGEYFAGYEEKLRKWLSVNPALDHREYMGENVCILNIRGGEYAGAPELFLERRYWLDAMRYMKTLRPDMKFLAVTDDLAAAGRVLPEVRAVHGDIAHDYTILKNARFLILSNSSFACFPAFTGQAEQIVAPKYWARHNTSDGFWSGEQNLYPAFTYLDREGKLFTEEECRRELQAYRARTDFSKRIGRKPTKEELAAGREQVAALHKKDLRQRAVLSLARRLHLIRRRDSL